MMRKTTLILAIVTLLLVSCGGAAAQPAAVTTEPPAQPAATEMATEAPQPAATETMTEAADPGSPTVPPTAAVAATQAPSTQAASSGGVVTYKIVPGESQLKYEAGEVFINDNNRFNLASGVTPQVSGEITVDMAAPQNSQIGTITADISQFKSDSSRRDNFIRGRFLESSKYPNVTFTATQIDGLPQTYTDGQEISLKINGDLTIKEVTKPVSFDATVKLSGDTLSGTATTSILMSDFGFGPISLVGMLKTEDQVKVTLTFVARP
jgi:polyisoprenoid-binding protein YceI